MAKEHLPPLGLLSIAGALIDAGHEVKLLDADYYFLKHSQVVSQIMTQSPDAIMLGHSGSTSAQPIINDITRAVRLINPRIKIIIGGVSPTYHWQEILEQNPQIDYIVCGEGEEIIRSWCEASHMRPHEVLGRLKTFIHCDKEWTRN